MALVQGRNFSRNGCGCVSMFFLFREIYSHNQSTLAVLCAQGDFCGRDLSRQYEKCLLGVPS